MQSVPVHREAIDRNAYMNGRGVYGERTAEHYMERLADKF